jgi:hypothetical protein
MTMHMAHDATTGGGQSVAFPVGSWVWANAVGLGVAYGSFGLFGDIADALGARHGIGHGIAAVIGLVVGGAVFVLLRRRVLAPHVARSTGTAVAAGIGLAAGFVVGLAIGGPPFDFVLGAITLGTIGGALQWRLLRRQVANPGGLLLWSVAAWLASGVAVGAMAVFAGDAFFAALGQPKDGTLVGIVSFTAFLLVLGLVGGAVGGAIEGRALRSRVGPGRLR